MARTVLPRTPPRKAIAKDYRVGIFATFKLALHGPLTAGEKLGRSQDGTGEVEVAAWTQRATRTAITEWHMEGSLASSEVEATCSE